MTESHGSKRTIVVVTTSRADYGHLFWVLRELQQRPNVDLRLVVCGPHLSPEFGRTIREIESDGFPISDRIECLLSSDSDVGMAKTIGIATMSLADCLGRLRPDLMLLIADRYEMLAPASVALALRIPVAHIEGGEISEGAIDDAVRNAITKMSHIHFTTTWEARRRVLAMGEEAWRVHRSGAPSLDHLKRQKLFDCKEVEVAIGMELGPLTAVIAYHPVTLNRDTTSEVNAVFDFLARVSTPIVFCFPNTDAGSRAIVARAREFCMTRRDAKLVVNLPHLMYWSLLKYAAIMVGNSSSGIMEAASLELPVVDIGFRQHGRERAKNVLHAAPEPNAIESAFRQGTSNEFRSSLVGLENPYGDGFAAERIANVLAQVPLDAKLLIKQAVALDRRWQVPETESAS